MVERIASLLYYLCPPFRRWLQEEWRLSQERGRAFAAEDMLFDRARWRADMWHEGYKDGFAQGVEAATCPLQRRLRNGQPCKLPWLTDIITLDNQIALAEEMTGIIVGRGQP